MLFPSDDAHGLGLLPAAQDRVHSLREFDFASPLVVGSDTEDRGIRVAGATAADFKRLCFKM